MTEPQPSQLACSLTPEEQVSRGREIEAIASRALVGRARREHGLRLEFRRSDAIEAALRDLVRRERECCPFLDFGLRSEQGTVTLDIDGPPEAAALLDAVYRSSAPASA